MNKEAKVGLGVILVLMITFISTVGWRLYHSRLAEPVSAAGENGLKMAETAGKSEKDASPGSENANLTAGSPRVIAAASTAAKPPQSAAGDDDLWNGISDAGRKKLSIGGRSESNRKPSYMPEPPRSDAGDRYGRNKDPDRTAYVQSREQGDIFGASGKADTKEYRSDSRGRRASAPSASGGRTHTVAEGESLFDIARNELGKASRWVEIYDLNAEALGNDIDNLTPGTQIILPDDDAQQADPLTRRSTTEYRKQ